MAALHAWDRRLCACIMGEEQQAAPHRKFVPPVTANREGEKVGGDSILHSPFMTAEPRLRGAFRKLCLSYLGLYSIAPHLNHVHACFKHSCSRCPDLSAKACRGAAGFCGCCGERLVNRRLLREM